MVHSRLIQAEPQNVAGITHPSRFAVSVAETRPRGPAGAHDGGDTPRGPGRVTTPRYVIPFREITLDRLAEVGGKNASLGELLALSGTGGSPGPRRLRADGRRVPAPPGGGRPRGVDLRGAGPPRPSDVAALARRRSRAIRERVAGAPLPPSGRRRAEARRTRELSQRRTARRRPTSRCARAPPRRICRAPRSRDSRRRYLNVRGRASARCRRPGMSRLALHRSRHRLPRRSTASRTATWRSRSACRRWCAATSARPA